MPSLKRFPDKDPSSTLDYLFDWAPKTNHKDLSDWLEDDETIISHTIEIEPTGLINSGSSIVNNGKSIQVWLDAGTVDIDYTVSCSIVTSNTPPRKDTRSFIVMVKER